MNEVEEIKHRLDVAEVVGSYIQLKQSGRNLKAPCPFHHEKTASFMVSPDKGIWHCFGCGEGGDIFKFVMKMEGLDFRAALELLAAKAGVELKRGPEDKEAAKLKRRLLEAHAWAAKYFQASLIQNATAKDYVVTKRKLKRTTIQDFQIGYAPESWDGLTKFLTKKGFTEDELVRGGLAGRRPKGGMYDLFRGRIMFTICDPQGQPVGFTGRVLDDSQPKYLNTPQTPLYDKSRAIYGLHLAKEAIRSNDEVVLVEGNMDVVVSHQAGVAQVVASSGTALTTDQLKTLSRLTKNIKLAFDQDAAGIKATERAIELAQPLGLTLKMATITSAKDPDELIQKDVSAWQTAINGAQVAVDYLFDRLAGEYDITTATGKRQYSDRLCANIKRLSDAVEQDHYIQLLATKLSVSADSIREKIKNTKLASEPVKTHAAVDTTPDPVVAGAKDGKLMIEEAVLAISLAYPDTQLSLGDLTLEEFAGAKTKALFEVLKDTRTPDALGALANQLPELADYAKILTLRGEEQYAQLAPADRSFEAFSLARRLQTLSAKQSKQEISRELRAAEDSGNAELAKSLLEQYQALMKSD
jgi:DNA primase